MVITWRAYELRPAGAPPISPDYRARIEKSRPQFAAVMKQDHGVDIVPGPFGVNSRPALLVSKIAEAQGLGDAFHKVVFEAYWLHGVDISQRAVLVALAAQAGLSPDAVETALSDPQVEARVDEEIAQARAYGLDGVPAVVLGAKYLVMGAQPYGTFASAVRKVEAE